MKRILFAALLVAVPPTEALAIRDPVNAADFLKDCEGYGVLSDERKTACVGYLLGVGHVVELASVVSKFEPKMDGPGEICWPDSMSLDTFRRRFIAWMRLHPEMHHRERLLVAMEGVEAVLSCDR